MYLKRSTRRPVQLIIDESRLEEKAVVAPGGTVQGWFPRFN